MIIERYKVILSIDTNKNVHTSNLTYYLKNTILEEVSLKKFNKTGLASFFRGKIKNKNKK